MKILLGKRSGIAGNVTAVATHKHDTHLYVIFKNDITGTKKIFKIEDPGEDDKANVVCERVRAADDGDIQEVTWTFSTDNVQVDVTFPIVEETDLVTLKHGHRISAKYKNTAIEGTAKQSVKPKSRMPMIEELDADTEERALKRENEKKQYISQLVNEGRRWVLKDTKQQYFPKVPAARGGLPKTNVVAECARITAIRLTFLRPPRRVHMDLIDPDDRSVYKCSDAVKLIKENIDSYIGERPDDHVRSIGDRHPEKVEVTFTYMNETITLEADISNNRWLALPSVISTIIKKEEKRAERREKRIQEDEASLRYVVIYRLADDTRSRWPKIVRGYESRAKQREAVKKLKESGLNEKGIPVIDVQHMDRSPPEKKKKTEA